MSLENKLELQYIVVHIFYQDQGDNEIVICKNKTKLQETL
jgi:hypothetical protein